MALDPEVLAALLNKSLNDTIGAGVGHTTERVQFCKALSETIINYLKTYAEVTIPDHESTMDNPAGAFVGPNFAIPPHRHQLKPLIHQKGKLT